MLVTFKSVDQIVFRLEVDPHDTVQALKEKIRTEKGLDYNPDGIKLIFAGKILDDLKAINDYKITEKHYIVIVIPRPKTQGSEAGKAKQAISIDTPSPLDQTQEPSSLSPGQRDNAIPLGYKDHPAENRSTVSSSQPQLYQSKTPTESEEHSDFEIARQTSLREFASSHALTSTPMLYRSSDPSITLPGISAESDVAQLLSSGFGEVPGQLDEQAKVSNWLENLPVEQPPASLEQPNVVDDTMVENVQSIIAMGFEKEKAEQALNASFNNVDRAIEYLLTESPEEAEAGDRTPSFALLTPSRSSSRMSSLWRMTSRNSDFDLLEYLRNDDEFQECRKLCQSGPDMVEVVLKSYKSSRNHLIPILDENEDRLVELLTEPFDSEATEPVAVITDTNEMRSSGSSSTEIAAESNMAAEEPPDLNENPKLDENPELDENSKLNENPELDKNQVDKLQDAMELSSSNRLSAVEADPEDLRRLDISHSPESSLEEHRLPPDGEEALMPGVVIPKEDEEEEEMDQESKALIERLLREDADSELMKWDDEMSIDEERPPSDLISGISERGVEDLATTAAATGRRPGRTLEDLGYVRVTVEEKQAIDRLKSLGFPEDRCVQIYLACEKNEELAANILLDKD